VPISKNNKHEVTGRHEWKLIWFFWREHASIFVGYGHVTIRTLQEIEGSEFSSLSKFCKETRSYEHGPVNTAIISCNLSLTIRLSDLQPLDNSARIMPQNSS
jgi:hypothetical protein